MPRDAEHCTRDACAPGLFLFDFVPPVMEETFGHCARVFDEKGFFDFGGEDGKGKGRDVMNFTNAFREMLDLF